MAQLTLKIKKQGSEFTDKEIWMKYVKAFKELGIQFAHFIIHLEKKTGILFDQKVSEILVAKGCTFYKAGYSKNKSYPIIVKKEKILAQTVHIPPKYVLKEGKYLAGGDFKDKKAVETDGDAIIFRNPGNPYKSRKEFWIWWESKDRIGVEIVNQSTQTTYKTEYVSKMSSVWNIINQFEPLGGKDMDKIENFLKKHKPVKK